MYQNVPNWNISFYERSLKTKCFQAIYTQNFHNFFFYFGQQTGNKISSYLAHPACRSDSEELAFFETTRRSEKWPFLETTKFDLFLETSRDLVSSRAVTNNKDLNFGWQYKVFISNKTWLKECFMSSPICNKEKKFVKVSLQNEVKIFLSNLTNNFEFWQKISKF